MLARRSGARPSTRARARAARRPRRLDVGAVGRDEPRLRRQSSTQSSISTKRPRARAVDAERRTARRPPGTRARRRSRAVPTSWRQICTGASRRRAARRSRCARRRPTRARTSRPRRRRGDRRRCRDRGTAACSRSPPVVSTAYASSAMVGRHLEAAEREVVVPGRELVLVEQDLLVAAGARPAGGSGSAYCCPSTVRV